MFDEELHAKQSYFVPMVDMLAGVVFILVILLASVTLVSRDAFTQSAAASVETAKIEAELAAARAKSRLILEPRRNAEAALRLLLERLQAGLATRGIAAEIAPEEGRLFVAGSSAFEGDGVALSAAGQRDAASIADVLGAEMACLSRHSGPQTPGCETYLGATLDRAIVAVEDGAGTEAVSTARALGILSGLAARSPALAGLKGTDGGQLLGYRAYMRRAAPAVATGEGAVATAPAIIGPRIVVAFQMDMPPLAAEQ